MFQKDVLHLDVDRFEEFDDLLAAATQTGRDVRIDLAEGDSLTPEDTTIASLYQDNFLFV